MLYLFVYIHMQNKDGDYMLTKEQVIELLGPVRDPFLHTTLAETDGIKGVTIKEDKNHVSVKIGISKMNTGEQMQMQQEIVGILKKNGANTVGLRFEQLPEEVIRKYQPAVEQAQERFTYGW